MVVSDINGRYANRVWHDAQGVPQSASYLATLLENAQAPTALHRQLT